MISVSKSGRLGNNMFQFAFGLTVARKLKTGFFFDTKDLEEHFELNSYGTVLSKTIRKIRYIFSLKFNKWAFLNLNLDVEPIALLELVKDHSVIYGYFQSEDFFRENQKAVRQSFTTKKQHKKVFMREYGTLFQKKTVCVAVRLTDYSSWRIPEINYHTPELTFGYFNRLIASIENIEDKNVIFLSDDIETVKANLGHVRATYISGETETLIALTLADELIISNSSFHWWGAWLNNKPNKVVYAPQYWLGHKVAREYPINIIPPGWRQVPV